MPEDAEAQFRNIFRKIGLALAEAGQGAIVEVRVIAALDAEA